MGQKLANLPYFGQKKNFVQLSITRPKMERAIDGERYIPSFPEAKRLIAEQFFPKNVVMQ